MINKRVTVPEIRERKALKKTISAITAYDYSFAKIVDSAGIDIVLVGDSLGCVIQGHETTLSVTLEEVIYHTRCVSRGLERALLVADLPFLSYQVSIEQAVLSSGRLIKEGGAHAVKLEGGTVMEATIAQLVNLDIPVMGHIGLTPQSYHRMGGHRMQGKTHDQQGLSAGSYERLLQDAQAVERAGAFAVVLEGIPAGLAADISAKIAIPTIGIVAGDSCDGQIRVLYDLLGLTHAGAPASLAAIDSQALDIVNKLKLFYNIFDIQV